MLQKIIKLLESGFAVITVNTRLTRHLRLAFDNSMLANGQRGWLTPTILPLSDWIKNVWDDLRVNESVVSGVRKTTLWESIVSNDKETKISGVHTITELARTASTAYSIIKSYGIPFPEEDIYLTKEEKALDRWIGEYEKKLRFLNFTDPLEIVDKIIHAVDEGKVRMPKGIVLAGFQEVTPKTKSLIMAIQKRGSVFEYWPEDPEKCDWQKTKTSAFLKKINVQGYKDQTEEVVQAARWIRKIYTPGKTIGIVVPELEKYKNIILHEFVAELDPKTIIPWETGEPVFNISLGKTLLEEPIINCGIRLLTLGYKETEIDIIGSLLRSPYINGGESEYNLRGKLDFMLRKRNYWKISLNEIINIISSDKIKIPILKEVLEIVVVNLSSKKGREYPDFWCRHFTRFLKQVRWHKGGERGLNSSEYQAVEAWNRALSLFSGLNDVMGKISRLEAVRKITQIVREMVHQPETPDSPIQVMGLLEATGFYFDHIRILGCTEETLPAKPNPNPFLSVALQKRFNTPHSSPEREFEFSKKAVLGLLEGTPDIVISFPKAVNNTETRLSPLFSTFHNPGKETEIVEMSCRLRDRIHKNSGIEEVESPLRIPLSQEEKKSVRGGTGIIKDQAGCPFRAFAMHRLKIRDWPEPKPGYQPHERGAFTHNALWQFWSDVKSRQGLENLAKENRLEEVVMDAVNRSVKNSNNIYPFSKNYLALERERLNSLLLEWLLNERVRANFSVLEMEKEERKITLSGLELNIRIDRIDQLEEGGEILIDYKTGVCTRSDLLSTRPKEPQLLIYSLSGDYIAVAFGSVRPGDCGFKGVSMFDGVLPQVPGFENDKRIQTKEGHTNWDELKHGWQKVIEDLADDFVSGNLSVDPKGRDGSKKGACEYCQLDSFCRIT